MYDYRGDVKGYILKGTTTTCDYKPGQERHKHHTVRDDNFLKLGQDHSLGGSTAGKSMDSNQPKDMPGKARR